ncbi:PAAR domain-containing protein [Sorangium sp. So ce302]|uniref:PAAR domain-containing protein n=1 Tax=unclassified Sorangium TaxID=2621164 RepID=UPI003F5FABB5
MPEPDCHDCPAHGRGPIVEGSPTVRVDALPLARRDDRTVCDGVDDPLVTGAATVMVNGRPAARVGELTSHVGVVATGSPNLLIGGPSTLAEVMTPLGRLSLVPPADGRPLRGNMISRDEYLGLLAERRLPNHDWTGWDVIRWKAPEWLGGGAQHLFDYKDNWIRDHSTAIGVVARMNDLPPELVAGVAHIEVGGDPTFVDGVAHDVRSFDHMADPLLEPMTVTRAPNLTSAGDVSIQIRRAAETLGMDADSLSYDERLRIMNLLKDDQVNLAIVGAHLRALADVDFAGREIGSEEIRVIGARYNRGPDLSLEDIYRNTSYGDVILRRRDRLLELLEEGRARRPRTGVSGGVQPASRGNL